MNTDFARQQMVEQQVRAWDVLDADILNVLKEVPREQFAPSGFEALAFADTEIPIGHGQIDDDADAGGTCSPGARARLRG